MFSNSGFIKLITRVVLAAFLYSFVAFEPLYGITTNVRDALADASAKATLDEQLGKLVLPARQGRISEGSYCGNKRLVIFVQDLHCNPEVQKNISDILSFFDTRYSLKKIFVEGAPAGKTDLSLFTGISDPAIKDKTLESLLGEGLLSGAVYYGAKNNKENIFGLENWALYKENAARMSRLLTTKSISSSRCAEIDSMLEETMGLHASSKLKMASYSFSEAEKSKDRYSKFAKMADKARISLLQYPNLRRQIEVTRLNQQINFKWLPKDLQEFLRGIQEKTPYGVYHSIAEKLSDNTRDGEFYLNLQEVAYTYASELLVKHTNVNKFLEYVRLNYSINPMCLVEEETRFKQAALDSNAKTLIDHELVFMQSMTDMLKGFVGLGMTPADYALLVKPTKARQDAALGTDFMAGLVPLAMLGDRTSPDMRTGADVSLAPAGLAPRENPYLKTSQFTATAFGPASSVTSTFNGAQPETKPPVPASALAPDYTNPPQPATPPALPDRLKPADDRKYFPQLKRF